MTTMLQNQYKKKHAYLAKAILGVAVCTSLASCSKGIQPEKHEPTKLISIAAPVNAVSTVFSSSTSANNKNDSSELQPVIQGQTVYYASSEGDVTAMNIDGTKLWDVNVEDNITSGVVVAENTNLAIVTTRDGHVVALNNKTGAVAWKKQLPATVLAAPLIANNRVLLAANNGVMYGLSLQTGDNAWQFSTQKPEISVRGSASPILLNQNTALFASADGRVHAITVQEGTPIWSRRVASAVGASEIERMSDVDASPIIDNNQLLVISYSGQLLSINLTNSSIMFVQEAASLKSLAVTDKYVIATTLSGQVKAFNRFSGELAWSSDALMYRSLSNPVIFNNYLMVGDAEGYLHILNPNNGILVGREKVNGSINQLIVDANGKHLMTQTQSGNILLWQ